MDGYTASATAKIGYPATTAGDSHFFPLLLNVRAQRQR